MSRMAADRTAREVTGDVPVPERLVQAATKLLAEEGPSAIKARTVASATGLSTMVVYSHFGGVPELVRAVVDHGFQELNRAFAEAPVTEDPVADLFAMALICRRVAQANPHLYDLMFGLSTRSTYRPASAAAVRSGRSESFRAAYAHLIEACRRLADSGRINRPLDIDAVAAGLWSYVHGFITLELAEHFVDFDDPVVQVMLPTGVGLSVGLGDDPKRARRSHQKAAERYASTAAGSGATATPGTS
jgi:AcrR family transcriptional regulator